MAGTGSALSGNVGLNAALLSGSGNGAELWWTPSRFGFSELGLARASYVQPFSACTIGAAVQRFGFEQYSEHRVELSAGTRVHDALRIGLVGNATLLHMARYGSAAAWGIDGGAVMDLTPALHVSAVARNILQLPFADGERLPVGLCLGIAWEEGALRIAADVEKESRFPLATRIGVEYAFEDVLFLRIGSGSAPSESAAGFGLRWQQFELSYAATVHPDLGWTHCAGIGFRP
jgi:hypothetical protein